MEIKVSRKQKAFMDAKEGEVLFGGAAGGGKSYGQIIDAMLYAIRHKGSKQLILRRSFPELEKSIIRVSLELYPKTICTYNGQKHMMRFKNGSLIDYGYIGTENDVIQYQSAEYDTIRFDELTHFTEYMYIYMLSRLRGANDFPKQIKSSTNPGSVGHAWVKERFIDPAPPGVVIQTKTGTKRFIPSKVTDNRFLVEKDPDYVKRLQNLPESERKALLEGSWDIMEGQYFPEFKQEIHVVEPFEIPDHWRKYRAIDYGLDCAACVWTAFDELGNAYTYRDFAKGELIISDAARAIVALTNEPIICTYAPSDLWSRSRDTGRSQAEMFGSNGMTLYKVKNSRIDSHMTVKEWLNPVDNGTGEKIPRWRIFNTCRELIKCLPLLLHDDRNPSDASTQPHNITHIIDAQRYLFDGRPRPATITQPKEDDRPEYDDQVDNFLSYGR